ncbi:MAG: sterol desaturase family protein [Nitratireductor sp.]|nr:sterol desaturase family protein [Nitratireductor sp.]
MTPLMHYLVQSLGFLIAAIVLSLLLLPAEKVFPRVRARTPATGRVATILVVALASAAASLLYLAYMQVPLIRIALPFQLVDLSRAPVADWQLALVSFLLLDFFNWLFHWLSHKLPPLWRLHAIHHADESVTALSTLLHHPLETVMASLFTLLCGVVFGLPLLIMLLYAVVTALHAVVTHANLRIPARLDFWLRLLIVTPDMHRTHHSVDLREGNSNFGLVFTIWDRLFGTYTAHPARGESGLIMGLPADEKPDRFTAAVLLLLPFRRRKR